MMSGSAALLHGLSLMVLACGLGCVAFAARPALPLPGYGRIAFGVAATPFVAASLLLLLTLVTPGLPLVLHAVAPALLGLGLILAWRCSLSRPFSPQMATTRSWRDPVFWAGLVAIGLVLVVIAPRLSFYLQQPTGNSDALQYLAQARHLLSHRSFFAIAGVAGLPDATLRGDAHGALWTAYNASALAWSGIVGQGLADDGAARLAFQATVLAYVAAGIALASAARMRGLAVLVILLILVVPHLQGASIGGDRDAFRLAALLLLCAFLLAHVQTRMRYAGASAMLLGAVLGGWAMQGHGLALVLVPLIVAPWALLSLLLGLPAVRTLLLTAAVAVGFGIGGLHVAIAYVQTGSLTGDNVDAAKVLAGTVYAQGLESRDAARVGEGAALWSRLRVSFVRDHGWPSVAALVVAAIMIASWLKRGRRASGAPISRADGNQVGAVLLVWFLSQTMLLLGLFDFGQYKLSDWTVLNPRYAMQWYLFAALLVAWAAAALPRRLHEAFPSGGLPSRTGPLLAGAILAAALATTAIVGSRWLYYPTSVYLTFAERLNRVTAPLPPECRTLSEDTGVSFHAHRPVLQLYSRYVRELVQETDIEALLRKLDERKLCAVVLYTGLYIDTAGPGTPISRLLASPAFHLHDAAPWRIYVRSEPAAAR